MTQFGSLVAASLVFLFLVPLPAFAADWKTVCDKKRCQLFSEIRDQDGKTQARVMIQHVSVGASKGKTAKASVPVLIAMLPLGIHIPSGVAVAIDDKDKFRALLLDCEVEQGCRAAFDLTGDIKKRIGGGKKLAFTVVDSEKQRAVTFTFPLTSFSGAYKDFETKAAAL